MVKKDEPTRILKGLKTGDCMLSVQVVARVHYLKPPLDLEVKERRKRFEQWIGERTKRFEQPITDALCRHIEKAKRAQARK